MIEDSRKKVFLILDNLRFHHGHVVKKWSGVKEEQIDAFFLPPCSLELNPDK